MTPPAWHVAVLDAEAAVKRDDGAFAFHARRDAERLLETWALTPAIAHSCPDRELFADFEKALSRWAGRADSAARDRVHGPLLSYIAALSKIPGEERRRAQARARLSPLERALPPHDR